MMTFEQHCRQSEEVLGSSFEEVHKYLDFYFSFPMWDKHRRKRHNKKGIKEVERLYGHEAAKAAYLHIVSDLKMDNWTPDMGIPEDEDDYMRMGLY